jgi:hypothetical protein
MIRKDRRIARRRRTLLVALAPHTIWFWWFLFKHAFCFLYG